MESLFSLDGKVAMVTGAGRWTGKAIALALAKAGADVIVTARTPEGVMGAAAEIRSLGRRSTAVSADMRDAEQVGNLVKRALDDFNRIDILVNNVGASFVVPTLKLSEGGWNSMIRENLNTCFLCSKAVAETMTTRGGGCIVNVASGEGLRAAPTNPAYGAAKAGVINLTMSLAVEWAQYNIRVNAVAPGFIDTPMLAEAVNEFPALQATFSRVPMKRGARLQEIAAPVVFLASDAAGYITGATLIVDGGLTSSMR